MRSASDVRDSLIQFLRRDLVGPAHGDDELMEERPSLRYSAGVLFPRASARDESTEASGIGTDPTAPERVDAPAEPQPETSEVGDEPTDAIVDTEADDIITLANTFKPAAMGLSYSCMTAATLRVVAEAAIYVTQPDEIGRPRWKRQVLELAPQELTLNQSMSRWQRFDHTCADGLRVRTIARRRDDGTFLCTTSVFNDTQEGASGAKEFFQVGLRVTTANGQSSFGEYRQETTGARDDEELSLAMLYRKRRVFAAGHGCAAEWGPVVDGRVKEVRTVVVPSVKVPPIVPADSDALWANMAHLTGESSSDEEILKALNSLPSDYERWIDEREDEVAALPDVFRDAGRRHMKACRTALARIHKGIELLDRDNHAMRAFKLMNAAMLRQQEHVRRRRKLGDAWVALPFRYTSSTGPRRAGYWRTFQIAFIMMTISGLVPDAAREERELVDLIWFPTGGGKTEAYLGVAAFAMFRRRLEAPHNAGCTILMRYTLRLLTSQQFQRAASLVCACELLRRKDVGALGAEPFSIGLWVGGSLTPNTDVDAIKSLNKMAKHGHEGNENPFQLLACPWCGTELNNPDQLGYVNGGNKLVFRCPANVSRHGDEACPFSNAAAPLPVAVVDEAIYKRPPTLLIGTVDKFAMLAWRPEASALFGTGTNSPPDLIIQDELHLISGPLGSMVGLYEGAIDLLCRQRGNGGGPKVIASTATIRRATDQCRALFDRPSAQFPPQGLDASDSYFAKEDGTSAGRIYVGFLPTAASSPLTAQIRAVAALSQGLLLVRNGAPAEAIDPYWTLVQYFSSLKELGRAATLVAADIPEYLPSMQRRYGVSKDDRRRLFRTEEMTSRKSEGDIPEILRDLERRYTGAKGSFSDQPLDTLLATNMISVGMDVDRLGLMMIVTQPKGTSEYIQASSRVGRAERAPGLVLTLYNAGRPRDRSHYEQFRQYHEAFYRFVEPTSVTPYSIPALERALHAVIVIVARHIVGLVNPSSFDPRDSTFTKAMNFLRARVERLDEEHLVDFDRCLELRTAEWVALKPVAWGGFTAPEKNFLMHPWGKPAPGGDFEHYRDYWSTPTSMRNVDAECGGAVVAYPAGGK